MLSLKVYTQVFLTAACLVLGLSAKISAHSHHDHVNVYVGAGNHHWNERVYASHAWYHPDHVYIYEGYNYPNYYFGNPYYYYDPRYYYYDNYPSASVNVNLNLH